MLTLIKKALWALLFDELAARRWLRGGLLALATGGVAFATEAGDAIGSPGAARAIRIGAVVAGFIAAAINLGEKNAKPEPAP